MIEPDHFDEKLAGGGSGPTLCWVSPRRTNALPDAKDQWHRVGRDPFVALVVFIVRMVTFLSVRFEVKKRRQRFETIGRASDMNCAIRHRNLGWTCRGLNDEL